MKVYAECNIVIKPTIDVESKRKRFVAVNMDIFSGINTGSKDPITLVIKGARFSHVWELMTMYHRTDEELAEKARGSALADLVEGMTVEEIGAWARQNILDELKEMEAADEDPLV